MWTAVLFLGVLVPVHWLVVQHVSGYTMADLIVDAAFTAAGFSGERGARFVKLALPFWFVGLCYEALPLALRFRGEIHVRELHDAELRLFGIAQNGTRVIPSTWMGGHLHPILDLLCGAAYLLYLPESILLGVYLFFRHQVRMLTLGLGFLIVNVAGQLTYVLYAAAPPWYVDQYGFGPAVLSAAQSPARGARFDAMTGLSLFHNFYSQSKNVFGAMPSLHCAYPVIAFLVVRGLGKRFTLPAGIFSTLVCLAAVYLNHHYVLDVLAGIAFAVASYALARLIAGRPRPSVAEIGGPAVSSPGVSGSERDLRDLRR